MTQSLYQRVLAEATDEWSELDALKTTSVYSIDKIARNYWRSPRTDWDVRKGHFPNLNPPEPLFFLQYEMPKYSFTDQGWQRTEGEQHGFLFLTYPRDLDSETAGINPDVVTMLRWFPYSLAFDVLLRHGNSMTIGLDRNGKTLPMREGDDLLIDDMIRVWSQMSKPMLKVYVDTVFATIHPCFLWINQYNQKLRGILN